MDSLMDNRAVYLDAAEAFVALVEQVPAHSWDAAALGVWDVRALVGHGSRALVTVRDYLAKPADSVACESAAEYFVAALGADSARVNAEAAGRGVAAGAALGDDPVATLRALIDHVRSLLGTAENPVITTIAGGMRLQDYLVTRVFELTVHSLDLADAVGLDFDVPAAAVERTVALLGQIGIASGRAPQLIRLLTGRGQSSFSLL